MEVCNVCGKKIQNIQAMRVHKAAKHSNPANPGKTNPQGSENVSLLKGTELKRERSGTMEVSEKDFLEKVSAAVNSALAKKESDAKKEEEHSELCRLVPQLCQDVEVLKNVKAPAKAPARPDAESPHTSAREYILCGGDEGCRKKLLRRLATEVKADPNLLQDVKNDLADVGVDFSLKEVPAEEPKKEEAPAGGLF